MKRVLLFLLLCSSVVIAPVLATAPVEPSYPGEGDILTAAWLQATFHTLFSWAGTFDQVKPVTERKFSTAGQSLFSLTNSFPIGKNAVHLFVDGIYQGVASCSSPNFTETTTTSITTIPAILLASTTLDFLIFKGAGE